jgi:hypothetical protein
MSLDGKTLKVCSCNRTVALDAKALASALKLKAPLQVHDQLCRRDANAFQAALGDSDVIVACTQEAALFGELAAGAGSQSKLQFVNVREQAGWSGERSKTMPKIAALVAMAALPEAEPAPAVEFKSAGQVLIVGPAAAALDWAERLAEQFDVSVLATDSRGGELPLERRYAVWSGKGHQHHRLAGRLRGRVAAAEPDRSRAVHPLQCLRAGLSGKRDRFQLPGRPRQVQVPPRLRQGLRRDRRHRFLARRRCPQGKLRHRPGFVAPAADRHRAAAAGLPRAWG